MIKKFPAVFVLVFALAPALQSQNFRVQAAAFSDSVSSAYFKDRGIDRVLVSVDLNGIYRYFVGAYETLDEAEKIRQELVAKGFPQAAIIDLEVQRALYEMPCTYFAGNFTGSNPSPGMNVRNIYFDSGSAVLDAEARLELDRIAALLAENPDLKLHISGHSDALGSAQANVQIATTRARNARNYLISRGVQADRMFLKVFGEAEPAVDNQDFYGNDLPNNRRWNRRVVLAIVDQSGAVDMNKRP
jgi:hypothetical protein